MFYYLCGVKKKQYIINLSLAVAVLFSILFQSFDSISHLRETFSTKKCHHTYNSKAEITHQHHSFDHCYVCQFGFSSFVTPQKYSFAFLGGNYNIPYFFTYTESIFSFSGSLYSYRGPPNCI